MIKKKISYWVNGGIALIDRYLISQLLPPFLFSVGLFASLGVAIGNLSDLANQVVDANQLGDYAWYDGNSQKTTHPVGQKRPNAWGLHDMIENVERLQQPARVTLKSGGLCAVVEVLLNSIKGKCKSCRFYG